MHRARVAGGLALSLLLTLLVPAASGLSAPRFPAQLTTASSSAGLTLTRVTPVVATPGQPISIGGVLDVAALGIDLSAAAPTAPPPTADPGTSDAASTGSPPALEPVVSVDVRLGGVDLDSHADVSDWVEADTPATGAVLGTADIVTAPDPTVDRIPFAVTIEDVQDRVRTAYGVIPVSVEVRLPGSSGPAAVRHTFLGYQERKEYVPLQLSWLVPFTVPADPVLLGAFGEERTAAWNALVGPEGTLRERLASARVPHTVWVLDPALLTPGPAPEPDGATGGATGEPTGAGEATQGGAATSAGSGDAADTTPSAPDTDDETSPTGPAAQLTQAQSEHVLRAEFAQALLEGVEGRDVLLLPRHDTDIGALPAAEETGPGPAARRDLVAAQLTIAPAQELLSDHRARVLPTLWPADGAWAADRDAALRALDSGGAQWSVLADPSSLASAVRGPVSASSGTGILPVDDRLSARVNAPGDGSALESGLALMADTLIMLNERPGTTRQVIVLPDRESPRLSAAGELTTLLAGVPWIELASLPADGAGAGDPVDLVPTSPDPEQTPAEGPAAASAPAMLEDVRAGVLSTTLERLPTAASVRAGTGAGSGVDLSTRGADSLAQLTSLRWRGHADDWQSAYQPIADTVEATFTGLSIPSRDVTFLADTGLLRVTVENALDADIANATLDLVVDHPILRIESGAQQVEVSADSRTTMGFEASSIATGRVQITATLRAPDGTVLADPTTFTVRVSPTSDWIYWVLLALAGGVILIGIVRTVLRRRPSA